MVDESTQLVIIDEWSATSMGSTLAKTILKGGWITTAFKHERPRSFFNNSHFYITTNQVPDFGEDEQENVLRRIIVYKTQSLPEVNIGADKWIFDNAMDCVAWMAEQINQNLPNVDANERWYEDLESAAITNMSASESCQHIPEVSSTDLQQTISDDLNRPSPVIHRNFTKAAEKATRRQRKRSALVPESPSTSDMSSLISHSQSACILRRI